MTQNLILSIFSFLPQVKIPNGLEDMICLGFWVYFGHFLKKGVFFGFFCFLKTFLEFKYKFKGCNFLVLYWFEDSLYFLFVRVIMVIGWVYIFTIIFHDHWRFWDNFLLNVITKTMLIECTFHSHILIFQELWKCCRDRFVGCFATHIVSDPLTWQ